MSFSIKRLFGSNKQREKLRNLQQSVREVERQLEQTRMLAAEQLVRLNRALPDAVPLAQTEFKVFSQFGDDGIIQYIVSRLRLPADERRFVEFGVETYREANTRFLLQNDNWSGLIMDGSDENMAFVQRDDIYWKHELTARANFITRENINDLLRDGGITGRIGLLSVDIDGNDYWVWQAITAVDPALVIVEYNGLYGAKEAVTIPYDPAFMRSKAHYSHLYSGASLRALSVLAEEKGYVWIGCNRAGNNAYFIRKEYANLFQKVSLPDDFVAAKFREARLETGRLAFKGQKAGRELLKDLPVYDVIQNKTRRIGDLEF